MRIVFQSARCLFSHKVMSLLRHFRPRSFTSPLHHFIIKRNASQVVQVPVDASLPSILLESSDILPKLQQISNFGDLKSLGFSSAFTPVGWMESAMEATFITTGLPWWATIIVSTVLVRGCLFPIAVKAQKAAVDLQNLRPAMDSIKAHLSLLFPRFVSLF